MEILFKNSFNLTEELILEGRVAFNNKCGKFISLFGLIMSLLSLIYFHSRSNFNDKFILTLFLIFFIYMVFFLPIIQAKKVYKQYLALHNYKEIQKTICFYGDSFESISSNGTRVSISYNNIKRIYNRKNMLVFVCKGDLFVFVKKDAFEQNIYDNFKTFIYTKTKLSF